MQHIKKVLVALCVFMVSSATQAHGVHEETGYELARKQSEAHDFDGALATLREIVAVSPQRGGVWLQIASLSLIQGNIDAARDACRRAMPHVDPISMLACAGRIALADGPREPALNRLVKSIDSRAYRDRQDSYTVWAVSVAAELAASLKQNALADRLFERALLANAPQQLRVAYADHLLATGRSANALALTEKVAEETLALQLRRLLASTDWAPVPAGVDDEIDMLDEQFRQAMAREEFEHAREYALFYLDLHPDPLAALHAASKNITLQKEPEDYRLLQRARCANGFRSASQSCDSRLNEGQQSD